MQWNEQIIIDPAPSACVLGACATSFVACARWMRTAFVALCFAAVAPGIAGLAMGGERYFATRVALVTGANKGIGFEIAKGLAKARFTVVLGCRDTGLGDAAARDLRTNYGLEVAVARVDLTEPASWAACVASIEASFGRLDLLVNNAAVCFNDPTLFGRVAHTPFVRQARLTIETNFFGTLGLTRACLPLLRLSAKDAASPRIVNLASAAGRLSIVKSPELRAAVSDANLEISALEDLMRSFVAAVEAGTHEAAGWPNTCYGVSKVGIIAMTRALARAEPDVMVNAVDPGFCKTDQNAHRGRDPASLGAATTIHLAGIPFCEPVSGKFFAQDKREVDWLAT